MCLYYIFYNLNLEVYLSDFRQLQLQTDDK